MMEEIGDTPLSSLPNEGSMVIEGGIGRSLENLEAEKYRKLELGSSSLGDGIVEEENPEEEKLDEVSQILEEKTSLENYKIGKVLGKGAYGKVHLGLHKLANMFVAMKSMSKVRLKEGKNNKQKVDNEVFLLNMIDHPGIVQLYEIFETDTHFLIIIELCPGGDMIGYVRRRKKLPEDLSRHFFIQLIHTVKYLHSKDISHRDIKLDNLLLDAHGNLKLCDFGVS